MTRMVMMTQLHDHSCPLLTPSLTTSSPALWLPSPSYVVLLRALGLQWEVGMVALFVGQVITKSKAVSGNQCHGQDCQPFLTVFTLGLVQKVTCLDYITKFPQRCVREPELNMAFWSDWGEIRSLEECSHINQKTTEDPDMSSGLLYEQTHSNRTPGVGLGKYSSFPTNGYGFLSWIMRVNIYLVFLFAVASRRLSAKFCAQLQIYFT